MNLLHEINELIVSLPNVEREVAKDFINNRTFDYLYNLVSSAIYKVEKDKKKETQKYPEANLDDMYILRCKISEYIAKLDLDDNSLDVFEDYEES
jgi:hypothetical protein